MISDLTARFLPRFAALTRERLRVALEIANARQHERAGALVHDLHAIAGEAGLLGLEAIMSAARRGEDAARQFGAARAEEEVAALLDCLRSLEAALTEAAGATP